MLHESLRQKIIRDLKLHTKLINKLMDKSFLDIGSGANHIYKESLLYKLIHKKAKLDAWVIVFNCGESIKDTHCVPSFGIILAFLAPLRPFLVEYAFDKYILLEDETGWAGLKIIGLIMQWP